jgi:hypothetical protein
VGVEAKGTLMCEWCGEKTPEQRRELIEAGSRFAQELRVLADYYAGLGRGSITPHDPKVVAPIKANARWVLRQLFEDWF